MSCGQVMYGAYYPYLYGRGAARSFHHAPHFQYDRFNVQGGGEGYGGAAGALSSGSGSSGAQSPPAPSPAPPPPRLRAKEEDLSTHSRASVDAGAASSDSEGECGPRARAQYVSANCVVFTHYSGDVAAVVDEHFARALALDKHKESVPLSSRNLPASFFNAAAAAGLASCAVDLYDYDPWHQHYSGYGHAAHAHAHAHRHAAEYHAAHNMAGYGGLLLSRSVPQYKPVDWQPALDAPHHAAHAPPPHYSYPPVHGQYSLEAQVQDSSKDLYWF